MFMPIGRDEAEIRRHAWVSYSILALNILVFFYTTFLLARIDTKPFEAKWKEITAYISENPHLRLPEDIRKLLSPRDLEYLDGERRYYEANGGRRSSQVLALERKGEAHLQELANDLKKLRAETPFHKYGYKPADGSLKTMITAMFVHGDFFHLLGNLMFFFVTGPFVEDVFGRPIFTALYFLGGIVATLCHAWQNPSSDAPLIGASGAIAAVMGAYLVRFLRSKFEFIFVPFWWRPTLNFRFFLPAFVVLPLWFMNQFWQATRDSGGGAGVAFWAHVGGFAFGMGFAGIMKAAKVEQKFVDPVVEKQTTWKQNEHLTRAYASKGAGDIHGMKRHLALALRQEPDNIDAARAAYELGAELQEWPYFAQHATLLLDLYIKLNEPDFARDHINEAVEIRGEDLGERFYLRAGAFFERQSEHRRALDMYGSLVKLYPQSAGAMRALMQSGKTYRQMGRIDEARILLQRARAHEQCSVDFAQTIDAQIESLARRA